MRHAPPRHPHALRHLRTDNYNRLRPVRPARALRRARLLKKHGDARLTDLLQTLADCPKARSTNIYDRCKVVYEGLAPR